MERVETDLTIKLFRTKRVVHRRAVEVPEPEARADKQHSGDEA
jgi:hypothetical protein